MPELLQGEARETVVFDVCDTLYRSNTTHDFVAYAVARSSSTLKKTIYAAVNHRRSPLRYLLVALYLFSKIDAHKKTNLRLLKGLSRNELKSLSNDFVAQVLTGKTIRQTHNLLQQHRAAGARIVLCSASIEPVVRSIADKLGVDRIVCTMLQFEKDRFTGRVLSDVTGEKLKALQGNDWFDDLRAAVSDNREDIALLAAAREGVAVVHTDKNHAFWEKHGLSVLDLRQ